MQVIDGARCFQAMVPMRDGTRLNTFVFLPDGGGPRHPVIVHRTPYGITSPEGENVTDPTRGWLPDPATPLRGAILRGWREITRRGYAAVYQDTRGRHGSGGEDRVYGDDAPDGFDLLEWIASEPWSNSRVGLSGSSAGATTALAAASQRHPSVRAFWAQVGGSSIYDDVVYEGHSIEMERLWLWVAGNIPGLSESHRRAVMQRTGLDAPGLEARAGAARERFADLEAAVHADPPYVGSDAWMHLPLTGYPDFATLQPYLDEILTHPAPDDFRARHAFRDSIDVPGFHATSWFDTFLTSVIAAFTEIQARVGNQRLWIGPNAHYFIYAQRFWPRDPYFEWFDHWLRDEPTPIASEPVVFYSPRAWVDEDDYVADDWRHTGGWPPPGVESRRLFLTGDGRLDASGPGGDPRSYVYDPRDPVPTLGGRNMSIPGGSLDQRPVQALPQYGLTYRGDVLGDPLEIAGRLRVTLHVGSSCPDTDFIAKLIEVKPDGRTLLLMDGVMRALYRDPAAGPRPLEPGRSHALTIDLGDICHRFEAGSRIQIDVTSSCFPRRARNTNSGNPVLAHDGDADIRVATNVVHHGEAEPSWVDLPVAGTRAGRR